VAELVDAPDLGSGIEKCESSSLSVRTIFELQTNHLEENHAGFHRNDFRPGT